MAIKKKSTKKKVKKKEVKPDGIYVEQSKSRNAKGQFYLSVWNNGRELLRSSETYHNYKDLLDSMDSATRILADYFIMANNKNFHDNSGVK